MTINLTDTFSKKVNINKAISTSMIGANVQVIKSVNKKNTITLTDAVSSFPTRIRIMTFTLLDTVTLSRPIQRVKTVTITLTDTVTIKKQVNLHIFITADIHIINVRH